jgi:glutamate---cysteine ligase / carboxylate-amine ligase
LTIAARFGESAPFSLGVEEEVMILDDATFEQVPAVERLVGEVAGVGRLKTELFASVVELNTGICESAEDAAAAVDTLRATAAERAAPHGLVIAAAGTHPHSVADEQAVAPEKRYRGFVKYAGASARRQGVNGLHVHVGMATAAECYRVLEGILPWLPLVLALSANSPWFEGRETGLMSTRAEVLAQLPRSGAPPAFGSYDGWERFVERFARAGVPRAADYTSYWWDVRPHPTFGTLEIRMPDQPTALERTADLVALLQALCKAVADGPERAVDPAARGDYQQNRWAALRFGPRAVLLAPDGERALPAHELWRELVQLVAQAADSLGTLDRLDRLDARTCEADRQLEVGRAEGLSAVCRDLVTRTAVA